MLTRVEQRAEYAPSAYPLDQWYCAALAAEVTRTPLARTLCDRQIVLFRSEAGAPVALTDRCPHRQAPLSAGLVMGDTIECPFHGMRYNIDGQCVLVPSQRSVPPDAFVRSYAVVERHQHIWIWLGNPAKCNPGLIPRMDRIDDPAWGKVSGVILQVVDYLAGLDNLLDDTHVSFVHRNSIGNPGIAESAMEMEYGDDWIRMTRWTIDQPVSAVHAKTGGLAENVDRWFISTYLQPTSVVIDVGSAPTGTGAPQGDRSKGKEHYATGSITPITANRCYYFWFNLWNYDIENPAIIAAFREGMDKTFQEDTDMLEAVQRNRDIDREMRPQINIAGDVMPLRARRMVAALMERED